MSSLNEQVFQTEKINIKLWHELLGHCNMTTIKGTLKEKLVAPDINLKRQ